MVAPHPNMHTPTHPSQHRQTVLSKQDNVGLFSYTDCRIARIDNESCMLDNLVIIHPAVVG